MYEATRPPGPQANELRKVKQQRDDLLAACEIWINHYDEFVRQDVFGDETGIEAMREAIKKAKGEDLPA